VSGQIPQISASFSDVKLATPQEKLFYVDILNSCGINLHSRTSLKNSYDIFLVVKFNAK
jgi:hypothetical protein